MYIYLSTYLTTLTDEMFYQKHLEIALKYMSSEMCLKNYRLKELFKLTN